MNYFNLKQNILIAITFCFVQNGIAQFNSTKNFSYDKIDGEFSNLLSLDIYSPLGGKNFPVIVFVHGGGWQVGDKASSSHINKRDFFIEHGFVFVSVNYRLAPDDFYPTYPQDVAKSLSFVFKWIGKFNGDNKNVFLMGHSAGAHLAALVATDAKYLNSQGHGLNEIEGVILLDGAGYDIPAVIQDNIEHNNQSGLNMYYTAFGESEEFWVEASPISHVNDSNIFPPIQMFYVETRRLSRLMSSRFYNEIIESGNTAEIISVANSSHEAINRNFGAAGDVVSQQALSFIFLKLKYHDF